MSPHPYQADKVSSNKKIRRDGVRSHSEKYLIRVIKAELGSNLPEPLGGLYIFQYKNWFGILDVQYGYTDAVKISAWLIELELQRLRMSGVRRTVLYL
jgi:hypothetical protein